MAFLLSRFTVYGSRSCHGLRFTVHGSLLYHRPRSRRVFEGLFKSPAVEPPVASPDPTPFLATAARARGPHLSPGGTRPTPTSSEFSNREIAKCLDREEIRRTRTPQTTRPTTRRRAPGLRPARASRS